MYGVGMRKTIKFYPEFAEIDPNDRPRGYYVYAHSRNTDGKLFYIGKGKFRRAWTWQRGYNRRWEAAASKHGVIVEIIASNLSDGEAFDLEREEIDRIGIDNLLNISSGGDGNGGVPSARRKRVICSNGMEFDSATQAAEWLASNGHKKASPSGVSFCCTGKTKSAYGFDWKYEGYDRKLKFISHGCRIASSKHKPVIRSDGVEFASIKDAAAYMGSPHLHANIGMCCRGKRNYACGYSWKYK